MQEGTKLNHHDFLCRLKRSICIISAPWVSSLDNLQGNAGRHRDSPNMDFDSSAHSCELSNHGLWSIHAEHANKGVRSCPSGARSI